MLSRTKFLLVSLFGFISLSLIFLSVKETLFKDKTESHYSLIFNDVSGLVVGSSVMISGVEVGIVQELDIIKNNDVKAQIYLYEDILLPIDTTGAIESSGLLVKKHISIIPGSFDDEFLSRGDIIDYTQSSIDLNMFLNMLIDRQRGTQKKTN
ncbi:MAG: MCE family protein [Alphaproteobacteria bacterium]|nr:MCE family protein [Alphaproteobacteria bacterium]